jgi:hypothetical protein
MQHADWLALGRQLYGDDVRAWVFECPICGNHQSGASVIARNPKIDKWDTWIHFSCEGRFTEGVGCNWTLGGLFQIHRLEVHSKDGKGTPSFEFADDPAKKPPIEPEKWGKTP